MNNRIINTFPWGLHFNHTLEPLNPGYKYTGAKVNANADEEFLRRKRIKIFDTNVPDLIPMDIVLEEKEEEEEEQGLVKQQRTLPPLIMDTDTASEEEEEEDIPAMPVLRRQTTCWINEDGLRTYNGCPFGNRLMNK